MIYLKEKYAHKVKRAQEALRPAYAFTNRRVPYYVYDVNYWLFGELPELVPDQYCSDDPSVMMKYQLDKIQKHFELYDDCYEPFLMPWFGTGVLASAFGTQVQFLKGMDPAVGMSTVSDPNFVHTLKLPNPYEDGIMPMVLNTIDYFKAHCDLPIGVTDCQGPLTTALSIIGYENFSYWTLDYPEEMHILMDKVTTALIQWIQVQKKHIGIAAEEGSYVLGLHMPKEYGGVWMSDDEAIIIGAELYKEFVLPYNERVFAAFGGGALHCCGVAKQHIENYCNTKGLTCFNNFMLDNIQDAAILQKALAKKGISYMACDFVPTDARMQSYYEDIKAQLDPTGLIVSAYVAPATALNKGKYDLARRNGDQVGRTVQNILKKLF